VFGKSRSFQQVQAYITPRALLTGAAAAEAITARWAWPLGRGMAYGAMDVSTREAGVITRLGSIVKAVYDKDARSIPSHIRNSIESQIKALANKPTFDGFDLAKPALMGVLNVTPDSFSDGGQHWPQDAAIAHGIAMIDAGAAIIDVGGESTRPGAKPVGVAEEIERAIPVVRSLTERGIKVSIDTRHVGVMAEAIAAGAAIINDITALNNPRALEIAARDNVAVVLMHMQGTPQTMQDNPTYIWAPGDIYDYLSARIAACVAAGIPKTRIAIDPGIGFGKTDVHNIQIMDHLGLYRALGCALAFGASRKGFIGRMSKGEVAADRLPGSLAAALHAAGQGAHILRVHDVPETCQALVVASRLNTGD
jgi:dihydropteroate synthase